MNSAFWSGLIEAIVAFFFHADMKGMMVFEYVTGFCRFVDSFSFLCVNTHTYVRGRFTCVCAACGVFLLFFLVHSCVIHNDGPVEAQRSAVLSGNKKCAGQSAAALPAWHYKCAILRGKRPPSPRCDHTSSLGGLCWLTGVSAKYGTDMISWPRPPTAPPDLPTNPLPYLSVCSALVSRTITHLPHLAAEIAFA